MSKSRRQRTMLGRIVKRNSLIEMLSAFCDLPRVKQRSTHEAMSDHRAGPSPHAFRQGQELRCKLARHVAIECHKVRDAKAIEDGEQQQRVFGRFSKRFSLFDQQTRPLHSRLGFWRSIAFDMDGAEL